MVPPKRMSNREIEAAPHEVWNAFVNVVLLHDYEQQDRTQRVGHLTLWYDSEVDNGGHLQYFENHGTSRTPEVVEALRVIGADCQADVLTRALEQRESRARVPIGTPEEYVETALAGEYDELDRAKSDCRPTICELLQTYVERHESSFVERVDD